MHRLLMALVAWLVLCLPALAGVDINTAPMAEFETLPGIGPSKAAAIVDYRTQNGPFSSVEQLDAVPGIGPATLANIRPHVSVGEGPVPTTDGATSGPPPATASASGGGNRININTASAGQLEALPGIGPSKAGAIVDHRTQNGPFASCEALQAVTGIGPATVASVRDRCTTE